MDWRQTVNLPQTDFPMRANLPAREPEMQRAWREMQLYRKIREARRGAPAWILHDGPPYANGEIHMGTTLNKVLKDIVVRHATMRGFDSPYVPGWDTHGLPIELRAIREYGLDRNATPPAELRDRCRQFAERFIGVMTGQFQRLAVLGDWEDPYVTLRPEYEARQVEVFGEMAARGFVYRGRRPVYWCADCQTALAESEIEFHETRSPAITVAFDVADGRGLLPEGSRVAIWTTTPWTLPANVAIALHPDAEYALVDGVLYAAALAPEGRRLGTFRGRELEGVACVHPFLDRRVPLVLADYVTLDEGTGAVHTAPGHGREDFETGQRYNLPTIVPLDDAGVFTAEAGPFAGLFYADANARIVDRLRQTGHLVAAGEVTHAYAHCWRCKQPVIWRATPQWFVDVAAFRAQALAAVEGVRWIPAWGQARIRNMLAARGDWCISRQRVWGVPIPVFYCESCGEPLISAETVGAVAELFREHGSNAWYTQPVERILGAGRLPACAGCGGTAFRKGMDIMDVWFDSGVSHAAVLESRAGLRWPADMYLEGSDQHRGWFQTSLLTAVATRGAAPFREVLTHGFVLDGQGRPMHKSLGNVVSPEELIAEYGADVVRLWAASSDYSGDVRIGPEILSHVADAYRKLRNTFRFLLGNLHGFDPGRDALPYARLAEVDRWLLGRLAAVHDEVGAAFEAYAYHVAVHALHNFCVSDLSAFYLDVAKDRLYTLCADDPRRRSAQTAIEAAARVLVGLVAPILPHTAEEVWRHLPRRPGDPESVHLSLWPEVPAGWRDEGLAERWRGLLEARDQVARALEAARAAREINASLEAAVELRGFDPRLGEFAADLPELLLVSAAELTPGDAPEVRVRRAPGSRCPRCWRWQTSVGEDPEYPDLCARCAGVLRRA
jgi:isoleucyl-tRNA synthetase